MVIQMNLGRDCYDIIVENGILSSAKDYLNLNRKVLVITDTGVPKRYAQSLVDQCQEGILYQMPMGEDSKSLAVFEKLQHFLLAHEFSRKDCIVAVGGGVVGDLAGFVASTYMRGIDFYNIPTTLLSQIDSSIGGKTAINFGGLKNIIGTFYQPRKVLIDPQLLKSLPQRQVNNGLAEAIKMAITFDQALFELLETQDIKTYLKEIICACLLIKKKVVEADEKEGGLRKVLNFGHTIGHGIESSSGLYHGECVALGMIPMCHEKIRPRLVRLLEKCDLNIQIHYDWEKMSQAIVHDKKTTGQKVTVIMVEEIGHFKMKEMNCQQLMLLARKILEEKVDVKG